MGDRTRESSDRSYDEASVREILHRAAEIDGARSLDLTERELREIAAEVGISPAALDAALRAHVEGNAVATEVPHDDRRSSANWLIKSGVVTVGGLLLGVLARLLRPVMDVGVHLEALIALAIMVAGSLLLSLRTDPDKPQCAFHLSNIGLWSGFVAGWSIVHGFLWTDLVGVMAGWGAGMAVVGGIVIAARNRIGRSGSDNDVEELSESRPAHLIPKPEDSDGTVERARVLLRFGHQIG